MHTSNFSIPFETTSGDQRQRSPGIAFCLWHASLGRLVPPTLQPRTRELPTVSRAQDVKLVARVHVQREWHVSPLLTQRLVPAGQLVAVGVEFFDPPV